MAEKLKDENGIMNEEFDNSKNVQEFLQKVNEFLKDNSDEEYLENIKAIGTGDEKYYGVSVPVLRKMIDNARDFCKNHPDEGEELLLSLWRQNSREERRIAAELISCIWDRDRDLALKMVMEFIPDLSGWELCDSLACISLKPLTLEHPDVVLKLVNNWVRSPNPWIRRFGIVSLIPLAQNKKTDDLDFFLVILKKVMKDDDEMVQKGVCWLLREITYKDPHRVGKFLEVFARVDDPATKKIIKEGSKKLEDETRYSLLDML